MRPSRTAAVAPAAGGIFGAHGATTCSVFICLALVCASSVLAQAPKGKSDDKAAGKSPEKAYLMVDMDQLRRYPENFRDKDIRISDHFDGTSDLFPGKLVKKGIVRDKYLEFQTSSAIGSNMRCYLPRSDKDAISLVNRLTKEAPITLEGTVYGIINTMTIFMVDRIYSGYEIPIEAGKPQITMVLQWEGDPKKYKYLISKPGQFLLLDPTTNKKITVEFQY